MSEPIFALATPLGGAIAVIRASGDGICAVLDTIFTTPTSKPGFLNYGKLLGDDGEVLDDAMAVRFCAPRSYTGEDMFELHIHGSIAVAQSAAALLAAHGLRPAEPGEFSKRAFLNGKMDLTRAEAVMDLIGASAKRGAQAALRQLDGELARRVTAICDRLTDAAALCEAAIDYPDEMEDEYTGGVCTELVKICAELDALISGGLRWRRVREGASVAIVGKPNAGKSSLLNLLTGEDGAIVTDIAGTTRDIIEREVSLGGAAFTLCDTAGLRDTVGVNAVERIGMDRTRKAMERADLLLVVLDGSTIPDDDDMAVLHATEGLSRIIVINKRDIAPREVRDAMRRALPTAERICEISALTGEGEDTLKELISAELGSVDEYTGGIITNARHVDLLTHACDTLRGCMTAEPDCVATDIRESLRFLGEIIGRDVDESVLDRVFERFCVGK